MHCAYVTVMIHHVKQIIQRGNLERKQDKLCPHSPALPAYIGHIIVTVASQPWDLFVLYLLDVTVS